MVGLLSFVVAGLAVGPSPVAADVLVSGYGEMAWGQQKVLGGLQSEFTSPTRSGRLAAGLRLGRFAFGLSTSLGNLEPQSIERHGTDRSLYGLGADVSLFFGPDAGFRPYVRLGGERKWIGRALVRRQCSDFGTCEAGFWDDVSGYRGSTTSLSVGAEYLFKRTARQGLLLALTAEVGYEYFRFRVVDEDVDGGFVGITIGFRVGGGRIVK